MKSPDPASLQNLNDIVLPATVGWWPLATGWWILLGLLLLALAWFGYQSLQRRIRNRYRRVALHELQLLEDNMQNSAQRDSSLRQIPILLKRTALSAYPRNRVASLSASKWHYFLNSKVKNSLFTESTFITLDRVSYSAGDLSRVDKQAAVALLNASHHWLKHHQSTTVSRNGGES